MTLEEYDKLPCCLRYKDDENCPKLDRWDCSDYDDPCEFCISWRGYDKEALLKRDYNEVISKIE